MSACVRATYREFIQKLRLSVKESERSGWRQGGAKRKGVLKCVDKMTPVCLSVCMCKCRRVLFQIWKLLGCKVLNYTTH